MKYNFIKHLKTAFISAILIGSASLSTVFAQGRILNIVEANPSVRSAAMGNTMLGNVSDMYIYTNPAAMLFSNNQISASYSSEIFPSSDQGRLMQHQVSGAFKCLGGALFIGGRLQSGYEIEVPMGDNIKPYEASIDFGYGFLVTNKISVYATASVFEDKMGTKANGVGLSVGASYHDNISIGSLPTELTFGARLLDAGRSIKYDDAKLPRDLPTSVVVGGDLGVSLCENHRLTYALSARYFTPKDAHETFISTGLEYGFKEMLFVRSGYQYANNAPDRFTVGLGGKYERYALNLSYAKTFDKDGVDTFQIGFFIHW